MAKAEFGTAKFLSNQLKAKGLQKLRLYCQVCQKQCRDENGFKSHIRSPFHMKNISKVSDSDVEEYTRQFEEDFLRLLRLTHGEKEIGVNKFYNEFIQDKHHIHMNATKFTSLTKFIQHLSKEGKIKVRGLEDLLDHEVDPSQLAISYIDRSHQNVLRKAKMEELSKYHESEQAIRAKLLQRQIETCREYETLDENKSEKMVPNTSTEQGICIDLKQAGKTTGASKKSKKKSNRVNKNVFK